MGLVGIAQTVCRSERDWSLSTRVNGIGQSVCGTAQVFTGIGEIRQDCLNNCDHCLLVY